MINSPQNTCTVNYLLHIANDVLKVTRVMWSIPMSSVTHSPRLDEKDTPTSAFLS